MEKDKYPLVSIIIPCYNNSKYISAAIDSALNQSYPNKEVIVIDDGSTDASVDVIKKYSNKIKWETGSNRGACAARNRGIELAQGDYIKFLDGDDVLVNQSLNYQIQILSKSKGSNIVICGCHLNVDEYLNFLSNSTDLSILNRDEDQLISILIKSPILAASLYNIEHLKAIDGFDEKLMRFQDVDLNIRLCLNGIKFCYDKEVVFYHRNHNSPFRISNQSDFDLLNNTLYRINKWENLIINYKILRNEEQLKAINFFYLAKLNLARLFFRSGLKEDGRKLFQEIGLNKQILKQSSYLYYFLYDFLGFYNTEYLVYLLKKLRKGI